MTLTIDIAPEVEEGLRQGASQQGIDTAEYARRLLESALQRQKNESAIALLRSWREQDATDDPQEIARAEAELAEFKQALNANSARQEPIFP